MPREDRTSSKQPPDLSGEMSKEEFDQEIARDARFERPVLEIGKVTKRPRKLSPVILDVVDIEFLKRRVLQAGLGRLAASRSWTEQLPLDSEGLSLARRGIRLTVSSHDVEGERYYRIVLENAECCVPVKELNRHMPVAISEQGPLALEFRERDRAWQVCGPKEAFGTDAS